MALARSRGFLDMKVLVGWRQHFRLVDTVHANRLQDLGLNKVTNAAFCHHRDRYGLFDLDNELRVAHTRDSTVGANIGWHTLQCHHCRRSGFFGDSGLICVNYVADYPAFEHFGKTTFNLCCSCLLHEYLSPGVCGDSVCTEILSHIERLPLEPIAPGETSHQYWLLPALSLKNPNIHNYED